MGRSFKDPEDVTSQQLEWEQLYARLKSTLPQFGSEDAFGKADYFLVDDNWGCRQHKLCIHNLRMLAPDVIKKLQFALAGFPNWEIVVAVEGNKSWPEMGLIVGPHTIVDCLQRRYFPREYRTLKYEGSHQGPTSTDND